MKSYNALRFAEVVELVDTSVSKTDGLSPCRFDSGLRYQSLQGCTIVQPLTGSAAHNPSKIDNLAVHVRMSDNQDRSTAFIDRTDMRRPALAMAISIFATIPSFPAWAAPDMQPGRWEITSTIEMPGMAFTMPAAKQIQCITGEDLVPRTQPQNEKCRMLESTTDGDTVTWVVKCESGGGTMTSQGKILYHGDSFSGSILTNGSQMQSTMTQKMTGKRIGDCR